MLLTSGETPIDRQRRLLALCRRKGYRPDIAQKLLIEFERLAALRDMRRARLAHKRSQSDRVQLRVEGLKSAALGSRNEVVVVDDLDGWHVSIYGDGLEPFTRTFGQWSYAMIFAQAQRKRLGLASVTRI